MGRVLAISSQVVRGHVGLSAIVPALQRLGHEVLPVPTVLLSNHPGHVRAAGTRIEVNTLVSMLDVLDANGWLAGLDAIMTGYMPTAAHADFAVQAVERARAKSAGVRVIVDPVAGDDPRGLYIADDAADALKTRLVPLADVLTPNRFELSWLSGAAVDSATSAVTAARKLRIGTVVATSIPNVDGRISNVCVTVDRAAHCQVERRQRAPQGTGDLLSGLFCGHLIRGLSEANAMARAVGSVQRAIAASEGQTDLVLTGVGATDWSVAETAALETL